MNTYTTHIEVPVTVTMGRWVKPRAATHLTPEEPGYYEDIEVFASIDGKRISLPDDHPQYEEIVNEAYAQAHTKARELEEDRGEYLRMMRDER